ncbi:chaplin [Streptomyces sp. MUM 203J]|uniref:chaplin n=1 Tax=Streptomyces sp. MUM 203J TaxID=2791990 RepID=UPI001F03FF88|nr:chaplin [Streptomyces sp. MUM 203J]MCH0540822.1 chaplin [Streptomyces sp. MUM 203J]
MRVRPWTTRPTWLAAPALAVAALAMAAASAAADDIWQPPYGKGNIVQREEHRPVNRCGNHWDSGAPEAARQQPHQNTCVNGR